MVFGEPLAFTVFPVNPHSSFAVDLVFLDDGGARVQTLAVGGVAVTPPGGLGHARRRRPLRPLLRL